MKPDSSLTLGSRLEATHGRPAGFDYLRLGLSVAIIAWHTVLVCYGGNAEEPFWSGALRPAAFVLVPAFFAMSGFLVAGSLERNNLPSFLALRGIRIYPALIFESLLSAVILGPLLTVVDLKTYFTHSEFWSYMLNIVGWVHYELPGVFKSNPAEGVNAQLWTVPLELECYAAIAALAVVGITRKARTYFVLLAIACVAVFAVQVWAGFFAPMFARPPDKVVILSFLCGTSLYFMRNQIPFNKWMLLLSFAASWVTMSFPQCNYLVPFPVAYLTVHIGLLDPPKSMLTKGADYSYGMYLYGFPVQQSIAYLFPDHRVWYFHLPLSLVVAALCAAFSWHFVEKPILQKRPAVLKWINRKNKRGAGRSAAA